MREHDILDEVLSYAEQFYNNPTYDILTKIAEYTKSTPLLETLWERVVDYYPIRHNVARNLLGFIIGNKAAPTWMIEEAADYGVLSVMVNLDRVVNPPAVIQTLYTRAKEQGTVDQIFDLWGLRPMDLYSLAKLLVLDEDKYSLQKMMRTQSVDDKITDLLLSGGAVPVETALDMLNRPDCPLKLLRTALGIERELSDPELWNLIARNFATTEARIKVLDTWKSRADFADLVEGHFRGDMSTLKDGLVYYKTAKEYRALPMVKGLVLQELEAAAALDTPRGQTQQVLFNWLNLNPTDAFDESQFRTLFLSSDWEQIGNSQRSILMCNAYVTKELAWKIKAKYMYPVMLDDSYALPILRQGVVDQLQLAAWIALAEIRLPPRDRDARGIRRRRAVLTGIVDRVTRGGIQESYAGPELLQVLYNALSRTKEIDAKVQLVEDPRLPIKLVKQATKAKNSRVASAAYRNLQGRIPSVNAVPAQLAPIP